MHYFGTFEANRTVIEAYLKPTEARVTLSEDGLCLVKPASHLLELAFSLFEANITPSEA